MRNYYLIGLFLSIFSLFGFQAYAEDIANPQDIVEQAVAEMLSALKENKDAIADDPTVVNGIVQNILLTHFDFNKMAKLALGKNWRKFSAEQKEQFIHEFQGLMIRTYSTALLEYTDEEIRVLPLKGDINKKRLKVDMDIIQKGGPIIPMALSVYLNKDNIWKAYDVRIDGISLVTNYRSTFSSQIRKEGVDALIASLAERNKKLAQ